MSSTKPLNGHKQRMQNVYQKDEEMLNEDI